MDKAEIQIIAVVGETASGKSGLAVEIAKKHNGEIISADSRAVFRGMDIGTAKPDPDEMQGIVHHGLDLVDPDQRYTAAQFKEYAEGVILDIVSRGKLPIIAGGTGLYVDGVLFDYSFGGDIDEDYRSELNNTSVDELATIAQNKNIEIDEQTLKNKRHLIRLIERGGAAESNTDCAYDALFLGYDVSRNKIRERIEKRVEVMFRSGLRKEYNELRKKFDTKSEAFTGIGYREFVEWELGEMSMGEVKRLIVKNTINLAKRQRTWFKRNPNINWISTRQEGLNKVDEFLS